VIRIYRNLIDEDPQKTEKDVSFYLEEPSYATMGLCYEKSPRFSGAVYNSFVRRLTEFADEPLSKALRVHEKRSQKLLDLDDRVNEVVKKLKAKGFVSPYLKSFVVARSNPLRFMKEPPELDDLINTIRGKLERFNVDKIKQEDIVASGGAPDED
jgi:ParB family chromosome partitioning protein